MNIFADSGLVFMGEFEVAIDEKNRVMIPGRWKSVVGQEIVLCRGFEGAIELRTRSMFLDYYRRIAADDVYSREARIVRRKVLGTAREIILDKWFRFVLPNSLVPMGGFGNTLMMRGNGDAIEIWDKNQYREWSDREENTIERAAGALASLKAAGQVGSEGID